MTPGTPPGPPFDLDVLADLHAGVYPDDVAAALRSRAAADPQASAVLAALDATTADLHGLAEIAPAPMPAQYVVRLDAAIAAEAAARSARSTGASGAAGGPAPARGPTTAPTSPGPVPGNRSGADQGGRPGSDPAPISSLDEARRRRLRNRTRWATGLGIAAAVAAVLTVGAVILQPGATPGAGQAGEQLATTSHPGAAGAQPAPSAEPTDSPSGVGSGDPAGSAGARNVVAQPHHLDELLPELDSSTTTGPFTDPGRLDACMQANGASASDVLGVIPVTYQGRQAYAVSLYGGVGKVRILVVGPDCGASGGELIEQQTATR